MSRMSLQYTVALIVRGRRILLFVVYYICLVHCFAPASSSQLSETVKMPAQPIEQQLKEVFWSDVEPETNAEVTAVIEVEEKPAAIARSSVAKPIADLLEGIEVEKLTLRKARKGVTTSK